MGDRRSVAGLDALIGAARVRETEEGLVFLLPPAPKVDFGEDGATSLFASFQWPFYSLMLAVALGAGAFFLLANFRGFFAESVVWVLLNIGFFVLLFVFVSLRDSALERWAPLTIELRGGEIRSRRRLLGGLMRATSKVKVEGLATLEVTLMGPGEHPHGEPAWLQAIFTDGESHVIIDEEYPEAWLFAIAERLAGQINAERDETAAPVRVLGEW